MKMNTNLNNIQDPGFKVAKDYFEHLEASIISHVNLKEKVSDPGFSVPKDYFKNIENDILTKVNKKEPVKVISLFNKKNLIYISGIAAAILLLFNLPTLNTKVTYASLSTETVEDFILNEDYSANDLATLFNDIDLLEEDGFNSISFTDEAMQDYLNNNLELNDLYTE